MFLTVLLEFSCVSNKLKLVYSFCMYFWFQRINFSTYPIWVLAVDVWISCPLKIRFTPIVYSFKSVCLGIHITKHPTHYFISYLTMLFEEQNLLYNYKNSKCKYLIQIFTPLMDHVKHLGNFSIVDQFYWVLVIVGIFGREYFFVQIRSLRQA